jgi:pilus assembly protein CpaB
MIMSLRPVVVVVLALTCGASATVGVNYMRPTGARGDEGEGTVPVVIAAVDISRGQTITAEEITVRQWPTKVLPPGTLTSVDKVVDRVAMSSILPGEPLFEKKLASKESGRGLEALVPEGMRAYTIQAKTVATSVAGFVLPGNRVDVLLHLRGQANDESGGGSTQTLLQAVEVLAVGQDLDAPAENRVSDVQSVTLLVTPDQVNKLDLGQAAGTLSLSLRNPTDAQDARPEVAILVDLRYAQEKPVTLDEDGGPAQETVIEPEPEPVVHEIVTLRGGDRGHVSVISFRKPESQTAPAPSETEAH